MNHCMSYDSLQFPNIPPNANPPNIFHRCTYDYLQIIEPPANLSVPYTKSSRLYKEQPLFQTRNPRHSTNRNIARWKKSYSAPSKVDIGDRIVATFANKSPNLILQPEDPSYDLRIPPPEVSSGRVPRKVCGDWSSKLKLLRHMTMGPLLALRFVSDYSNHYGGYKAKVAMENGKLTFSHPPNPPSIFVLFCVLSIPISHDCPFNI